MGGAIDHVLGNDDLLLLIFEVGNMSPVDLVATERVCRQWRRVYHDSSEALVKAATPPVVTKRVLMGLYALSSDEAASMPHTTVPRRGGGFMHLYPCVKEAAWARVGGTRGWQARLECRGAYQASVEHAFGSGWRVTRWKLYTHQHHPALGYGKQQPALF